MQRLSKPWVGENHGPEGKMDRAKITLAAREEEEEKYRTIRAQGAWVKEKQPC